jgi:RNA polymerase sigma factor (TIGR02999 family)
MLFRKDHDRRARAHQYNRRVCSTPDATPADEVTRLLHAAAGGSDSAVNDLLPLVYDSLRSLAADFFLRERRGHTLQPTALVHEAYLRLVRQEGVDWQSRGQFFVIAGKAMRNILVDHARGRNRAKRGGDWGRLTLDGVHVPADQPDGLDMLALDDALERLTRLDERKARLVELRFFAGLSSEDAAQLLGISRSTAAEEWRMARAWLHRELKGGAA